VKMLTRYVFAKAGSSLSAATSTSATSSWQT
jgi:hypothetical protein